MQWASRRRWWYMHKHIGNDKTSRHQMVIIQMCRSIWHLENAIFFHRLFPLPLRMGFTLQKSIDDALHAIFHAVMRIAYHTCIYYCLRCTALIVLYIHRLCTRTFTWRWILKSHTLHAEVGVAREKKKTNKQMNKQVETADFPYYAAIIDACTTRWIWLQTLCNHASERKKEYKCAQESLSFNKNCTALIIKSGN